MREVCVINVQELTQWCVQLLLTNAVPNGMIGFCRPPVCVPWTYRQVNQHSLAPSNKLSVCNTELWLFYNTFICRERISHWRNWLHGEFQTRFCLFCLYLIYVRFITRESRMSEASLPSSGRLSVRPSVTFVICIKTVQARITKSSLWAAPRSLVYRDKISCHWVQGFPSNEGVKEGYPP